VTNHIFIQQPVPIEQGPSGREKHTPEYRV